MSCPFLLMKLLSARISSEGVKMAYRISIKKSAIKSLVKIPESYFSTIKEAIYKLSEDSGPSGYKRLKGRNAFRIRVSKYRIIYEIQEQISYDFNQEKIGKTFKVLIDKKGGGHFVGRTEFDSVEVDASKFYCRVGDFVQAKVFEATEFDLYGEVVEN
jgi:mRNA-degrading endonuclease RelE of RelBE toxin-antitoxin system